MELLSFDSITLVDHTMRGRAVLAASHGGALVADMVIGLGLGGVILNDAGVGRDRAGIAGLDILDRHRVPAAAVSAHTARIGDRADCLCRGSISYLNMAAVRAGITPGMPARLALEALARAPSKLSEIRQVGHDWRRSRALPSGAEVVLADSSSLVTETDAKAIFVTGSHGGLLGNRPETAIKWPVFAAIYNDASVGIDDAGVSRLPTLDLRGIAGATVSAWSARIGDAQSTFDDGYISRVNRRAELLGAEIGISCIELVSRLSEARSQKAISED